MIKNFLFSLALFSSLSAKATTRLLLIGGGDYPLETLQRMMDWAPSHSQQVLLLSWATDDTAYSLEHLTHSFSQLGKKAPTVIFAPPYPEHPSFSKSEFLNQLQQVGSVMISGGDQNTLMDRLESDPDFSPALHAAFQRGVVFAGNSAGTAAAPTTMLTGNGDFETIKADAVETRSGLGFLKHTLIDQHFIARRRQNRLLSLLQTSTERLALGIDEDCTLAITDERSIEVIGPGMAMSFDNQQSRSKIKTQLHYPGDIFSWPLDDT
jgi:cyanophycinase